MQPVLEMLAVEKHFGGVRALQGAELTAFPGEILGLCGENGAGKSTLLKVLSGVIPHGSYRGEVRVDGVTQRLGGVRDARRAGIAIVHQELMLVPHLTVADNLLLGREPMRWGVVDQAALDAQARRLLERFGFAGEMDAQTPVADLGVGLQQIVEIVRALSFEARILVLDEPTAALTASECERLMSLLRDLRARGTTCIYVSHRLDEVFALCDRITLMRDGRTAKTVVTSEVTVDEVIDLMVGRELGEERRAHTPAGGVPVPSPNKVLELVDLRVGLQHAQREAGDAPEGPGAQTRRWAVDRVSLTVHEGEIVAVCGAMGSGRTALLTTLFGGALGKVSGAVLLAGEPFAARSARAAIARGIALVPEDRKRQGVVPSMTVAQNLALPSLASRELVGAAAAIGLVDGVAEAKMAERRTRELRIRGDPGAPVSSLSGGNQQKVALGKWLEHPPKLLLLDEPTRGVDVGAREEIYGILEALARRGVGIIFASSDIPEVLRLAHRILVLRHGRIVGELEPRTATQQSIVNLSTGADMVVEARITLA